MNASLKRILGRNTYKHTQETKIPDHMHHIHHTWKPHPLRYHHDIVGNASEFHASIWPHVQRQQVQAVVHESQTFLIITKFKNAILLKKGMIKKL